MDLTSEHGRSAGPLSASRGIIQIDCDGVLCRGLFGLQSWALRTHLAVLVAPIRPIGLGFGSRSGVDAAKAVDRLIPRQFYRSRPACPGSAAGLWALRAAGYRLVLVTGRSARYQRRTTEEWLARKGMLDAFDDVICCPDGLRPVEHKLIQARRLQPVVAVEDDPTTAMALRLLCPVWLIRTPFLRGAPTAPGITVHASLLAAVQRFLDPAGGQLEMLPEHDR